jgi:hypothetical protein
MSIFLLKNRGRFFFSFIFVFFCAILFFLFLRENPSKETESAPNAPVFNCPKGTPLSVDDKDDWGFGLNFSCYANYYRLLVAEVGAPAAILDLKNRTKDDLYLQQRCHELTHVIGESALKNAVSPAEAFAKGDAFCANGYYHGIMQELIHRQGNRDISKEFLNNLCVPFRAPSKTASAVSHINCAHGIGHGIMYANSNEVFEALKTCDLLDDETEQEPCWGGVFMENLLTDFKEHRTKYVNPEDLLFPCNAVEDKYEGACYTYQSSYIFKITKSFEKTFAACKKFPKQYQDVCFRGVGGNAATLGGSNMKSIQKVCVSIAISEHEQKNCVNGAMASIVSIQGSLEDGRSLCAILPENLQSSCLSSAIQYYELFQNKLYTQKLQFFGDF